MVKASKSATKTILLGAGASRSVNYDIRPRPMPSPLDSDFFQLLQRLEEKSASQSSVDAVLNLWRQNVDDQPWDESMERLFFRMHLRETLREKLLGSSNNQVLALEENFATAIAALLRAAHKTHSCGYHTKILHPLHGSDAIITFNYDLVAERALKALHSSKVSFGPWLYGFESRPKAATMVPTLFKLHGSMNWITAKGNAVFAVRQESWDDFDEKPGYRATGPAFPILLPFWDKKIEEEPWASIWRKAAHHLKKTENLLICGYSLPLTDIKAAEFIRLTLAGEESRLKKVAVVDPSRETRNRWRRMLMHAEFWPYDSMKQFISEMPDWWK